MKALTLTQPWATLVAIGAKRLETRSWRTDYRGPLAIHAAKSLAGMTEADYRALRTRDPFWAALSGTGGPWNGQTGMYVPPRGAIIAVCELTGCFATPPEAAAWREYYGGLRLPPAEPERSFGDYSPGRYAWRLENVRALATPIPAQGALGLWQWEPPAHLVYI